MTNIKCIWEQFNESPDPIYNNILFCIDLYYKLHRYKDISHINSASVSFARN